MNLEKIEMAIAAIDILERIEKKQSEDVKTFIERTVSEYDTLISSAITSKGFHMRTDAGGPYILISVTKFTHVKDLQEEIARHYRAAGWLSVIFDYHTDYDCSYYDIKFYIKKSDFEKYDIIPSSIE